MNQRAHERVRSQREARYEHRDSSATGDRSQDRHAAAPPRRAASSQDQRCRGRDHIRQNRREQRHHCERCSMRHAPSRSTCSAAIAVGAAAPGARRSDPRSLRRAPHPEPPGSLHRATGACSRARSAQGDVLLLIGGRTQRQPPRPMRAGAEGGAGQGEGVRGRVRFRAFRETPRAVPDPRGRARATRAATGGRSPTGALSWPDRLNHRSVVDDLPRLQNCSKYPEGSEKSTGPYDQSALET